MVAGHGILETGLGDAIRGCLVSKVGRTNHQAVGVAPHRNLRITDFSLTITNYDLQI